MNNKLRMNNRLTILMMTCLAIVVPRLDGQTSPIALDLSVPQSNVGSAKKIEVTMTNRPGQDVVFEADRLQNKFRAKGTD
jgi:hypothetical protein